MSVEMAENVLANQGPKVFDNLANKDPLLSYTEPEDVDVEVEEELCEYQYDDDEYQTDDSQVDADMLENEEWINLWGDDDQKMRKMVIRRGEEKTKPQIGYLCKVNALGSLMSGQIFEELELMDIQLGDSETILGIDIVLMSMDVGEKALVEINSTLGYGTVGRKPHVSPNEPLIYLVELISACPEPDKSKYTVEELRAIGTQKRERGNWWYARNDNTIALNCYERALDYLGDRHNTDPSISDPFLEDRLKVYNNMAAIHLKIEQYEIALEAIDYVVTCQPKNVKALFRKGKILAALGNFPNALEVLTRAINLEPDNNAVRTEVNRITSLMKSDTKQSKTLFKMMLGHEREKATAVDIDDGKVLEMEQEKASKIPPLSVLDPKPAPASKKTVSIAKSNKKNSVKQTEPVKSTSKWHLFAIGTVVFVAAGIVVYGLKDNTVE